MYIIHILVCTREFIRRWMWSEIFLSHPLHLDTTRWVFPFIISIQRKKVGSTHLVTFFSTLMMMTRGDSPRRLYSFFGNNEGISLVIFYFPTMGDSSLVLQVVTGLQTRVGQQAPTVLIGFISWWWQGNLPSSYCCYSFFTNGRPFIIHSSILVRGDSPRNVVDNYI